MFSATRCAVLLVVLSHASLSVSVRAPSSPRVPGVRVCVRHRSVGRPGTILDRLEVWCLGEWRGKPPCAALVQIQAAYLRDIEPLFFDPRA